MAGDTRGVYRACREKKQCVSHCCASIQVFKTWDSRTYLFLVDARVAIVHLGVIIHALGVAGSIAVQFHAVRGGRNHLLALLHIMLLTGALLLRH
jgi:hypothetical protein